MKKISYAVVFLLFISALTNEIYAQSSWKAPKEADEFVNPLNSDTSSVKRGKKNTHKCVLSVMEQREKEME